MKTCVLIYNPHSGHALRSRNIKEYRQILTKYGYNSRIIPTQYRGHAKELVYHLETVDLVISIPACFIIECFIKHSDK